MMTEQESLAFKRTRLELRCRVLNAVREFFLNIGFLEVQTPVRTPAPAPEVHIDAIPADGWFLAASPELYMKRLLAAGYEKIFQISPVFRRGEVGRLHHPEFTLLEWYRLGADYTALQEDCETLLRFVCQAAGREGGWFYRGRLIEMEGPWQRYTVREAFGRFAGWEPGADPDQDRFDVDMVEKVEPNLGFPLPCFLVDYPASQAALARLKSEDPSVAERFELYWAGLELANGFSELTDPTEQRQRFEAANEARRRAGRVAYPLAETFLQSLDHLPACAGIALGVDRLIMLLSDADHIDQVVAFSPGS
jgi:lysyl-tRNA synthetase class 2